MYIRVLNNYGTRQTGRHDLFNDMIIADFDSDYDGPIKSRISETKNRVGYCIYDLNHDGIEELIIGEDPSYVFEVYTMDKLVSIVLALAMILMVGAAFASSITPAVDATTETDGTVKVTNAAAGQTYKLYKLFDADMGANDAITYTLPSGKTEADLSDADGNSWFELNSNGFVVAKSTTGTDWAKNPAANAWAQDFGTQVGTEKVGDEAKTGWTGLSYGYYYVDTTLGAFIGVNSANKIASITEKNEPPTIDKEIVDVDGSTATLGTGDDTTDPGQGVHEKAIAQVGDPIAYKLTVAAKPGALNYVVTDTLSAGLTPPTASGVAVSVSGTALTVTDDYTVAIASGANNTHTITITFTKDYLDTITTNTSIVITYTAYLNDAAVIGEDGNPNDVTLTWGNDPTVNHDEDEAKVYTAKIDILKTDNSNPAKPLEGAGFVIKNASNKYYKLGTDAQSRPAVLWVEDIADADEHVSDDKGIVPVFEFLKNGSYTLVEKTVPSGYNKLDDVTFSIANDDYTNTNLHVERTVVNNTGTTLPETGGIGTTIFYILGGLLVVGAAVILVARRKASN